ncbi:MAG: peptidylprolyl isomerase [Acidimicrobiales bacterium]
MPSEKRQRQDEGRLIRLEQERSVTQKVQRKRQARTLGLIIGAIVVVAGGIAIFSADDADDDTSTEASDSPDSSAPTGENVVLPGPGASITGETPCPPSDGSAERTTEFEQAPPMCIDPAKSYTATLETTEGDIVIELDAANAPETVNNFVVLSRYHYFDGLPFHRVVPGFVNQTGSSGVPDIGSGGPGYDLPAEPPTREYAAGDVAMAQGGGTNSGSQFFFTIDPTSLQGGTYPIFGTVSEGQDVVQAINDLGAGDGPPSKSVTIDSVTITES